MPEKKGYLWDPMYGILSDVDPVYYDDSLTEPAVVSAPLPAKFNGSQEAARRYAEGYKWGQKNVVAPRERVAPYVAAGLGATMLAPYAIGATATGVTNPWVIQFGKRMLLDLPAFEVMDRLPTLIGQDRATVQAGNLAERGFRALSPDGAFEENVAPYVNQAGQFVGGFVPGMMGDVAMRGGVSLVNRIGESIASDHAGYFEPIAEMMQERPIEAVVNSTQNRTIPRGTDFDVDAAAFRYDQTGIETPIITGPGGNVTEARIPGDVRQRVLAGHPEMAEELAALQNNPAEMQRAMQEMAAMTPEQIAETQAILTDVAKGNRAVKETLLHEAPKPIVEAPLANGYSIERYPGYQLKMLMAGNPLEKQIGKNGTVNINNINALKQKASKVEQAVIDKVLASDEFAGQKAVDYNKFRKAVQDELITYERKPDSRWADYGLNRLGLSPIDSTLESDYEYYKLLDKFIKEKGYKPIYGIDDVIYETPDGKYITEAEIERIFKDSFKTKTNTYTFSSPRIPKGSAKHFDANTLGHSRTYTTADEPDVLHVMESQSDWAQNWSKSNSENHDRVLGELSETAYQKRARVHDFEKTHGTVKTTYDPELNETVEEIVFDSAERENKYRLLKMEAKEAQEAANARRKFLKEQANNPEISYLAENFPSRHIQENLRYAAEHGQKKMRYPTRETAAKIEGYPERTEYFTKEGTKVIDPYIYDEEVVKEIASLQDEIDKLDLVELSQYAPFNITDEDFVGRAGNKNGQKKLLAALRERIIRDTDSLDAIRRYGDENDMVGERLERNKELFEKWVAKYEKEYEEIPDLDNIIAESRKAHARREEISPRLVELLKTPRHLNPELIPKKTYQHENILQRYSAFPKQYQKLFKGADVRTVTDPNGNTWYEVDVPENYLQQEWAYKSGGLLNRLRSHYGSDDKIREAIQMARGGKVNKMANGGPEEALHNLASWIGYQTVLKPEINKKGIDEVRLRLYDNLSPFSYDNPVKRVKDALKRPPVSDQERRGLLQTPRANYNDVDIADDMYKYRDDIWRTYLQVPRDKAHGHFAVEVEPSDYRPTKASYEGPYYRLSDYGLKGIRSGLVNEALTGYAYGENGLYSLPVEDREHIGQIVRPIGVGESALSNVLGRSLGTHTISRGIDPQRGEYVSYYDLWDIAPFGARNASDQSHGIGEPIHFYDRIYLDDYFGVKPEIPEDSYYGGYLTPAFVESYLPYENDTFLKDYRSGGKIHIKPENRGKFTALKKRTGHSASWFKAHGTPAQKKMAVFALNARKWKHGNGGIIDRMNQHYNGDTKAMLELIRKVKNG